jgi:peptidoglycan hydrolase-like protein with peptidoglycan-binding domain
VGERSFLAVAVQHMLDELEKIYLFSILSSSGVYDEITAANIREFQARNRINATGEVDRETWDALAVQFNLLDTYPYE